ncbi:MAG: FMN-binding protein [Sedimentibacter sp.]
MKKLALILCAVLLLSMVACADDNNDKIGDTGTNNTGTNGTGTNNTGTNGTGAEGVVDENALTGTAQGYGGEVTVTVTVDGDDVVSVEAVGEKETEGVGSNAIDELPGKIEEADSTDVDAVAGATVTSNAIKEAVDKALEDK